MNSATKKFERSTAINVSNKNPIINDINQTLTSPIIYTFQPIVLIVFRIARKLNASINLLVLAILIIPIIEIIAIIIARMKATIMPAIHGIIYGIKAERLSSTDSFEI